MQGQCPAADPAECSLRWDLAIRPLRRPTLRHTPRVVARTGCSHELPSGRAR